MKLPKFLKRFFPDKVEPQDNIEVHTEGNSNTEKVTTSDKPNDKISALLKTLETDPDLNRRCDAAKKLRSIENNSQEVLNGLATALQQDKIFHVREKAAQALGYIGDESVLEPLLIALSEEHPKVRSAAANSLGKIASSKSVNKSKILTPLIEMVQNGVEDELSHAIFILNQARLGMELVGYPPVNPLVHHVLTSDSYKDSDGRNMALNVLRHYEIILEQDLKKSLRAARKSPDTNIKGRAEEILQDQEKIPATTEKQEFKGRE
jgi:hypothetical protein